MQSKNSALGLYGLLAILLVLFILLTFFNFSTIVPPRGNRFDFYPRWQGGQALWRGENPYSPEVTAAIQQGMFGGVLPPEADQQRMVYPAYVGLLIAPLLPLPPSTAIAIWLSIQLVAVLVTPIVWLAILGWKPRPWLLGVLLIGLAFVFRYPVNMYIVGQFTGTILLGFSLALWCLQHKRDTAAGLLLACTAVPPTIAIPLALLLLLGCVLLGRFRALAAFIGVLAALTAFTIVQVGWWIPDFIAQLGGYSDYAFPVWAPGFLPPLLRVLFVAALVGVLFYALLRLRQTRNLVDFSITALIACLLLLPQTGNYYLVLLIPPLLVIFQRGNGLLRLAVALAILSPWFMRALPDPSLEALLLPVGVLLLWLWMQAQNRPIIDSA